MATSLSEALGSTPGTVVDPAGARAPMKRPGGRGMTARRRVVMLETFPNPNPQRAYEIRFDCPEFTCVCPKTGQPDFATFRICYFPAASCIELKSLKVYLWSFRDVGAFHEAVTNQILDDLVRACAPRFMEVEGDFNVRGGIHTVVVARHGERPPH